MSNYCKHCSERIYTDSHYCTKTGKHYSNDSEGDFALSMIIAMATDSAIIGGLLGGSMEGGVLGDILDGDLFD